MRPQDAPYLELREAIPVVDDALRHAGDDPGEHRIRFVMRRPLETGHYDDGWEFDLKLRLDLSPQGRDRHLIVGILDEADASVFAKHAA